ncbi:REP-associated tyrosine transposase [Fodinibius salsisoli]|uniref:Transposase n=1 Tax=Fodinibius salsisoli TaxID=2820877 RepID=A0ABT3PSB8_9BACT|nr:transposase [Fodinibius salsisoli]MCW9708753.1 transposase [Fodinibius salsisoli]
MKIYDDVEIYFVTSTIIEWYPVFTKRLYFDVIVDSLQYCQVEKDLRIHAYVIMLDHIHLVVSLSNKSPKRLSDVFRDFKRFTSREITMLLKKESNQQALNIFKRAAINDERKNNFKVWQEGFHPKGIYNEKFGLQKLEYIHSNPVKKGCVLKPEHWQYSSAGFYCGYNNVPLEVEDIFKINE